MPTSVQIGVYPAVKHYLKAVQAAGTLDRDVIARRMRDLPIDDALAPMAASGLTAPCCTTCCWSG